LVVADGREGLTAGEVAMVVVGAVVVGGEREGAGEGEAEGLTADGAGEGVEVGGEGVEVGRGEVL
jgi:hypothetical protein